MGNKTRFVFLSYINRSGSTYLANLLSKSPYFCVCPEAEILYTQLLKQPSKTLNKKQVHKLCAIINNDIKFKTWKIKLDYQDHYNITSIKLFSYILELFKNTYYPQAEFILFKNNHLLKLVDLLPKEQTINMVWINLLREPKAIYASQKQTISPMSKKRMGVNPISFINEWNNFFELTRRYKQASSVMNITYEALIGNQDEVISSIFGFVSSGTHTANAINGKGQIFKWLTQEYQHIHPNINNPPSNTSLNLWKNILSVTEIAIIDNYKTKNAEYTVENEINEDYYIKIWELWYKVHEKIEKLKSYILKYPGLKKMRIWL